MFKLDSLGAAFAVVLIFALSAYVGVYAYNASRTSVGAAQAWEQSHNLRAELKSKVEMKK